MKKLIILFTLALTACVSVKNTIQNIDNNAVMPQVMQEKFVITEYATDSKYGHHPDYPVNLGFYGSEAQSAINVARYFNAIYSTTGKKVVYTKIDTCCPFPTKRDKMGAGTLDIYELSWENSTERIKIYINLFEKGKVQCPKGLSLGESK